MTPRFSLYGNFETWNGNIQEDPGGQWVRWKDVAPYIQYCAERGVNFDPVLPSPPSSDGDDLLLDEIEISELDEDEFPMDDDIKDTFEFMERNGL